MKLIRRVIEIKIDDNLIVKQFFPFVNYYPHLGYLLKDFLNKIIVDQTIGLDLESVKNIIIEIKKESEFKNE